MQLDEIENALADSYTERESLNIRISRLDETKGRIAELENSLAKDIFKTHQIWEDANHWVEMAIVHLNKQSDILTNLQFESLEKRKFVIPNEESREKLDQLQDVIFKALDAIVEAEKKLKCDLSESLESIKNLKLIWENAFTTQRAAFNAQLREQGVSNLALLNQELARKRHEQIEIEERFIPKLRELIDEIESHESERKKLLKKLHEHYLSLRECRIMAANIMTKRLSEEVKIEIIDTRNTEFFYNKLSDATPRGTQAKSLSQVVNHFTPQEFVNLINVNDIGKLMSCGLTENAAKRMLDISQSNLLHLERVHCDDIARIQLKIEGTYRDLGALSEGEKCTAILSIILLDENRPLVIDQPEDELDHDFIMSNVVNTLSEVKQRSDHLNSNYRPRTGRQFIIATHNQNIPVLGSAELVVRMRKVKGSELCEVLTAYGLEHPETILQVLSLEGGRDAFERRRQKYFTT